MTDTCKIQATMRAFAAIALSVTCQVSAAGGPLFHTKSGDNFMCGDPKDSALLLDERLGRQKIPEPDLQAIYSDGDCMGTPPTVVFELVTVNVVRIFDRPYRIATVRFIPTAPGEMAFINYVPADQIEQAR